MAIAAISGISQASRVRPTMRMPWTIPERTSVSWTARGEDQGAGRDGEPFLGDQLLETLQADDPEQGRAQRAACSQNAP